jgi:hypothetical protein
MRIFLVAAAAIAIPLPALAQDIALKPLAEARLRYEHVDQDGLPETGSDALTARVRAGLQASSGGFSALAQMQGTLAIIDSYYDGLHGTATRPLIADPQNVALYLAQLQYKSKVVTLTGGRQHISLDDERFVGNVGFRDNAQTFDGVRAEVTPAKGLKLDLSYVWDVRTIWGIDGAGARQRGIAGDNVLANLSYATPVGTITGFAYLVDQDEPEVQGFRLSSQSYGARFAGSHPFTKSVKLGYQLSYAHQTDWHRNPNSYAADYALIDTTLDVKAFKLGAGFELLGADQGAALTSFQTSLGTNFKFQGWADKFLTTPPDGVRDYYGSLGYGLKALGPFKAVSAQAIYHRFTSDRLVRGYGDEIDMLASGKLGKTVLSVRYARYEAGGFATDTRKFWLQADWAL